MSFLASPTLHKLAAVLYGLIMPGHVVTGFQKVYPSIEVKATDNAETRLGRVGARLCWNIVTTMLLAQAAFHWKWSRSGASNSKEETLAVLALTAHIFWNGCEYIRAGEIPAGPLLVLASATGMTAFVSDIWT